MKIAYLLSWELGKQDGVTKKVFAQTEQWLEYGHDVKIFCIAKKEFSSSSSVPVFIVHRKAGSNIISEFTSIGKAYKELKIGLTEFGPDVIYHRSEIYHPELKSIMDVYPTVVEVNTNDLAELKQLARKSLKGKVRFLYYNLIRDKYLSSAAGFCCVTNEIASLKSIRKYNKPIKVIPNTINIQKFSVKKSDNSEALPKLLFMGTPDQDWHGVDKIVSLAKATISLLHIEVVGPPRPDTMLPPNITFHGYLKQAEYEEVLADCSIGICSLALHRNNMNEACPLKTREYLAYGLPIIIGYSDTAFIEEKPDWVLQLPNHENNIVDNIDKIVSFCYTQRHVKLTMQQVRGYIDSGVFENKRVAFLESLLPKDKLVSY